MTERVADLLRPDAPAILARALEHGGASEASAPTPPPPVRLPGHALVPTPPPVPPRPEHYAAAIAAYGVEGSESAERSEPTEPVVQSRP
eukprot:10834375-Alexandrium_andersonii.AAC.1